MDEEMLKRISKIIEKETNLPKKGIDDVLKENEDLFVKNMTENIKNTIIDMTQKKENSEFQADYVLEEIEHTKNIKKIKGIKKLDKKIKKFICEAKEFFERKRKEKQEEKIEEIDIFSENNEVYEKKDKEHKPNEINNNYIELPIMQETLKLNSKEKKHLLVNVKENEYDFRTDNGNQLGYKIITGDDNGIYKRNLSSTVIEKRRKEISKKYNLDEKNTKNVDTTAYKMFEEYDKKYGTNYATKYIKIMCGEPKKRKNESEKDFKKRKQKGKAKLLKNFDIDFNYNIKGILSIKDISLKDKINYMKNVKNQQKFLGDKVKVQSNFGILFKAPNKVKMLNAPHKEEKKTKKKLHLSKMKFPKMKFKSFQIPKINLNIDKKKAKSYFGRTVVAGIAALSLMGGIFKNNSNSYEQPSKQSNIEYTMDTNSEAQDLASIKRQEFRKNQSQQDARKKFRDSLQSTNTQEQVENTESQIQETTEKVEENSIMQQINDLLNNEWEITEGRYYSSPDGTGNSGKFENHQGTVKVDMVNLLDENGRKICTISLEDLGTLPEDIKEQVKSFQYHMSNENTTLGWNTDKQLDELKANNSIQNVETESDIER